MAELGLHPFDHRLGLGEAADVGANSDRPMAAGGGLRHHTRDLLFITPVDSYVRAFACEANRNRATDARARAGDQSGLAGKSHGKILSAF
jgi:hypothetical protein